MNSLETVTEKEASKLLEQDLESGFLFAAELLGISAGFVLGTHEFIRDTAYAIASSSFISMILRKSPTRMVSSIKRYVEYRDNPMLYMYKYHGKYLVESKLDKVLPI